MERAILHCDLNNFYASVECLYRPELYGKAVAVCGNTDERHGIVLAKSEPAKKAGVKTGDTVWQAKRKCRELIVVQPHMREYVRFSNIVRNIYRNYTDMIEPYGIDECYLDVTGSWWMFGTGEEIAEKLRKHVREETGLTISVGVSFNKVFAKLGSDMKKPDAVTIIKREEFREKIWSLPAENLLYVGRSTLKQFKELGIHTIGDIAAAEPKFLSRILGKGGIRLWQYANGLDTEPVMKDDFVLPVKSVGHGITCTEDLVNQDEVYRVFLSLTREVSRRLRRNRLMATKIQISVKNNDLNVREYQTALPVPTQNISLISKTAAELFARRYNWERPVRALTVRAIDLIDEDVPVQTDMFFDMNRLERRDKLERAVENIQNRFGRCSVMPASLFLDNKMPKGNGRPVVTLPNAMKP